VRPSSSSPACSRKKAAIQGCVVRCVVLAYMGNSNTPPLGSTTHIWCCRQGFGCAKGSKWETRIDTEHWMQDLEFMTVLRERRAENGRVVATFEPRAVHPEVVFRTQVRRRAREILSLRGPYFFNPNYSLAKPAKSVVWASEA